MSYYVERYGEGGGGIESFERLAHSVEALTWAGRLSECNKALQPWGS
jgi:hypothetical protein